MFRVVDVLCAVSYTVVEDKWIVFSLLCTHAQEAKCSFVWYKNLERLSYVLSQSTRLTDRQTDRRTDGQLSHR